MLFRLSNVTKTYGPITALRQLTVEVPEGAVGLLGPNGAGKTTLIRTLLGLITIDSGGGGVNANYTIYDGNLYLIGEGAGAGLDLIRVDAAGVAHEIDVNPGVANAFDQSDNFGFAQFDGSLYFTAYNAASTNFDKTSFFHIDGNGSAPVEVTYNGHSLDNAGEDGGFITFNGGVSATFTVVAPGEIDTSVPPGALFGPVRLLIPAGILVSDVVFRVTPRGCNYFHWRLQHCRT